jgi:radical SAM protein with 4Fe4S-binding SPASM domain
MEETYDTYEKILISKAFQKGIPLNASLELLPLCNMNCQMCYVRLDSEEMKQKDRLRTAEEWFDLARQMKEAGILFVMLTGGEPLLYPDFKKVYLGLRSLGMIVTVNTNGTLLDEHWADFFAANPPRRINVTLYGTDKEVYKTLCGFEGGYERAVHALHLLAKRKISVKINGSLVQANKNQIDKIVDMANKLGMAVNVDTYMYPAQRERPKPFDRQLRLSPEEAAKARFHFLRKTLDAEAFDEMCRRTNALIEQTQVEIEQNAREYRTRTEKMHCQAGRTSFAVNWQGQMQLCVMLKSPSVPVFEMGIEAAWQQLKKEADQVCLSENCSKCNYRAVCNTCAACALHEGGSFDAVPQYMCQYMKAFCALTENDAMK